MTLDPVQLLHVLHGDLGHILAQRRINIGSGVVDTDVGDAAVFDDLLADIRYLGVSGDDETGNFLLVFGDVLERRCGDQQLVT